MTKGHVLARASNVSSPSIDIWTIYVQIGLWLSEGGGGVGGGEGGGGGMGLQLTMTNIR
jgi:hypothetical protein